MTSIAFWHLLGIICVIGFAVLSRLLFISLGGKTVQTMAVTVLGGVFAGWVGLVMAAMLLWGISAAMGGTLTTNLPPVVLAYVSACLTFALCWILGKGAGHMVKKHLPPAPFFYASLMTGLYMTLQPIALQWMIMLGLV